MELALAEFQYHESRGSYYPHREPFPPNTLLAGVVELALVEFCIASPLTFWGLLMMIHDT